MLKLLGCEAAVSAGMARRRPDLAEFLFGPYFVKNITN
jgi:hypothetical protein